MSVTSTFEQDYETVTRGCGLIDRSERGKLALTGAGAKEFLNGQVTNEIVALTPGTGVYAAFLTQKGKMQGDLRVLEVGPPTTPTTELLLDTERPALQDLFNMIRNYSLGHDVQLHKRTLESGLLSLIGPQADEFLGAQRGTLGTAEHDHMPIDVAGAPVRAIRTNLGVDLLFAAEDLERVRGAAIAAGAVLVGEEAAECLRIESGRPRYGVDLDDGVIPQEAGLNARAVSFTKGCYVGQETVARLFYKGKPNRELRGLRSESALAPGTVLRFEDREVATVTSSAVSPRFGAIALALVRREAPVGSVVAADDGSAAEVTELPFA